MSQKRKAFSVIVLSVALPSISLCAPAADDFPNRTVEMIVPFAAGGPADMAARIVQPHLSAQLRVPVVIINRTGAGGAVGMDFVAKAKPDGYTLAATSNSTLVTVPAVNANVSYSLADFAAIGTYAVDYQAIISRPDSRWNTIDDFIAYARKNPGKLSYGSSGTGGISYFNMEILKMVEKLDITHVPYQGTGPVKNAIMGGHVDVATSAMGAFRPLVQANNLVFLVITAPRRLDELPGVPTMLEKGFKSATLNTVMQIYAPAKVPHEALARLRKTLESTMRDPGVRHSMEKAGLLADYHGPEATVNSVEAEIASVRSVMKTLKVN
jgi:tripartite-type tricarboxylate transporter receptor subunit TctC